MWSRRNLPILLLGMYTVIATVENSIEVSKKSKNITNTWSSNSKPRYVSEKNTSLKRCMHTYVHSSIIYNRQFMDVS